MRTPAETNQIAHTFGLWLKLHDRGVACSIHSRPDDAPVVRLDALSAVEITALADGHFEAWAVDEPLAPVASYLSLDEALALLCAGEHRA